MPLWPPGLEVPLRLHQRPGGVVVERQRPLDRQRLAVVRVEARLGVERVDARRAAVHEQEDHALGLRREVRRARPHCHRILRRGTPVVREQAGQAEHAEAAGGIAQQRPPRHGLVFSARHGLSSIHRLSPDT
jgi:hypothetical protein